MLKKSFDIEDCFSVANGGPKSRDDMNQFHLAKAAAQWAEHLYKSDVRSTHLFATSSCRSQWPKKPRNNQKLEAL